MKTAPSGSAVPRCLELGAGMQLAPPPHRAPPGHRKEPDPGETAQGRAEPPRRAMSPCLWMPRSHL